MDTAVFIQNLKDEEVDKLYSLIPLEKIEVLDGPRQVTVMAVAKDCFGVEFCLGEVVAWLIQIRVENIVEEMILADGDPKRVLLGAIVKIADKTNLSEQFLQSLSELRSKVSDRLEKLKKLINSTKVRFEDMPWR